MYARSWVHWPAVFERPVKGPTQDRPPGLTTSGRISLSKWMIEPLGAGIRNNLLDRALAKDSRSDKIRDDEGICDIRRSGVASSNRAEVLASIAFSHWELCGFPTRLASLVYWPPGDAKTPPYVVLTTKVRSVRFVVSPWRCQDVIGQRPIPAFSS